jgi:hypothetical protein
VRGVGRAIIGQYRFFRSSLLLCIRLGDVDGDGKASSGGFSCVTE